MRPGATGCCTGAVPVRAGRHLGNFPQAFTHLALINAVMKLIAAEEEMLAATPSPGKVVPRPGAHGELYREQPSGA